MVAYGVDHGVERPLNVVKGYRKPPTPPSFCQNQLKRAGWIGRKSSTLAYSFQFSPKKGIG
jgi:hypothetical protein